MELTYVCLKEALPREVEGKQLTTNNLRSATSGYAAGSITPGSLFEGLLTLRLTG
jgi:hypothetical protein